MSINISASLISDFLSCNRKVDFRINSPESSISSKESFIGIAVHSTIEKHWNDAAHGIPYLNTYLDISAELTEEDRKYANVCADNFYQRMAQFLTEDDSIEKFFKIKISNDVYVVGKIDRICNGVIYDWKTKRLPPKKLFDDPQFMIYEWAYEKLYGKKPIYSVYGALATGEFIVHKQTEFGRQELFESVIPSIVDSIRRNEFPRTGYFTRSCFRCQYKDACLKAGTNVVDS